MDRYLIIVILTLMISSCINKEDVSTTATLIENDLKVEMNTSEKQSAKENQPSTEAINNIPKNYIKKKINDIDVYVPDLIKIKKSKIEYTANYDTFYSYLNLSITNTLNRKITSILFQLESVDCANSSSISFSKDIEMLPNETKDVRINLHSQIIEKYRLDCLKHSPIVKASEAILETKERYLNIETIE